METKQEATPIQTEPLGSALVHAGPTGIDTTGQVVAVDPREPTELGVRMLAERVRSARQQFVLAMQLVSPGQIIVMTQSAKDGTVKESIYLTGGAADRILRMGFGMRWGEEQVVLDHDDDVLVCTSKAALLDRNGEVYQVYTGRRRLGGYAKTKQDLIKACSENRKHLAVTDILGLRFLTPEDLKELGVDISKLPRRAEFQEHGADESGVAVVPWGHRKGTPVTELEDKDISFYVVRAKESLADESKKRFHPKEQRWLNALEAEQKRRTEEASKPKEAGRKADPQTPAGKVALLLDVACIADKAERAALVKAATGKTKPAELTEDDVARVQQAITDQAEPGSNG